MNLYIKNCTVFFYETYDEAKDSVVQEKKECCSSKWWLCFCKLVDNWGIGNLMIISRCCKFGLEVIFGLDNTNESNSQSFSHSVMHSCLVSYTRRTDGQTGICLAGLLVQTMHGRPHSGTTPHTWVYLWSFAGQYTSFKSAFRSLNMSNSTLDKLIKIIINNASGTATAAAPKHTTLSAEKDDNGDDDDDDYEYMRSLMRMLLLLISLKPKSEQQFQFHCHDDEF